MAPPVAIPRPVPGHSGRWPAGRPPRSAVRVSTAPRRRPPSRPWRRSRCRAGERERAPPWRACDVRRGRAAASPRSAVARTRGRGRTRCLRRVNRAVPVGRSLSALRRDRGHVRRAEGEGRRLRRKSSHVGLRVRGHSRPLRRGRPRSRQRRWRPGPPGARRSGRRRERGRGSPGCRRRSHREDRALREPRRPDVERGWFCLLIGHCRLPSRHRRGGNLR